MLGHQVRGVEQEGPQVRAVLLQRQVDPDVHAAVAEVAVGQAVDAVVAISASNSRR